MLNIPERLFILSIDDQRGAVVSSARISLRYGLAGALLAELALVNGEVIPLAHDSLVRFQLVVHRSSTKDFLLDMNFCTSCSPLNTKTKLCGFTDFQNGHYFLELALRDMSIPNGNPTTRM